MKLPVMNLIARVAIGLLCLLLGRPQTLADPPAVNQSVPGNEVTTFKGKLKGMQRGIVMVEKDDGSQAMVAPPDSISSFQFIAKAKPAFLRRGMMVRVTGNFGPNGLPVTPITKVTLFQPVPLQSIPGHGKDQFTPGVHSDARNPKQRNQPMMGKLTIVGQLIGLSPQGVLALQAGKTPVQIPVNADTQLEIRYNNLSLAQENDPVNVAGFYNPPNENQVKADRITVTTDRVYGEVQAKSPKKRRGKKTEEEADKPAEEKSDAKEGDAPNEGANEGAKKDAGEKE